jgi:hypothetical protein
MKKKVLIGIIIAVVLILASIVILLRVERGYKIVYHNIDYNVSSPSGVKPEKVETFYVKSNGHVIYFYKYFFDSLESLKKYKDFVIKSANVSFQKIIAGNWEGLMGEENGVGLIFEKGNTLLLCSIKSINEDKAVMEWFLEKYG